MERHNGVEPDTEGAFIYYADAQAQIEALQAVIDDHHRLVRELDVSMNGVKGAAKQASLCDLVSQIQASQLERDSIIAQADAKLVKWIMERIELQTQLGYAKTALDAEQDDIKMAKEVYDSTIVELRKHLSQLHALVRALPVLEHDEIDVVDEALRDGGCDDYRTAIKAVLTYRATLDATPLAAKGGDGK